MNKKTLSNYILAFDEINALTAVSYNTASETTEDQTVQVSQIADDILSLLINAYRKGVQAASEMLAYDLTVDVRSMDEVIYLVIDGKTFEDRVADHVLSGDLQGLQTLAESEFHTMADNLVQAKDYTDKVHQEITTEYGTKLDQTSKNFNLSVNSLSDRVTEQGNEVSNYREELETYFDFGNDGLQIGKKINGENQQYSINIDNEKMGFLQDGSEVAYIRYNKLHINAVEAMDRLSVGAAADGGYFDFISTEYGMGVKWRAVEKTDNASIASVMRIPRRARKYVPVVDDDNIFQMEVSEE